MGKYSEKNARTAICIGDINEHARLLQFCEKKIGKGWICKQVTLLAVYLCDIKANIY